MLGDLIQLSGSRSGCISVQEQSLLFVDLSLQERVLSKPRRWWVMWRLVLQSASSARPHDSSSSSSSSSSSKPTVDANNTDNSNINNMSQSQQQQMSSMTTETSTRPLRLLHLDQTQWHSVIQITAGLGAGAISTSLLYPLDLIKVRYQVHENSRKAYRSLAQAFRALIAERGMHSLFRGMSPALYGATISWGLYMYFYQKAKERYQRLAETKYFPQGLSWQHFCAGMEAGLLCVPLTNPIWLIKVRMQVQSLDQMKKQVVVGKEVIPNEFAQVKPYKSVTDAFRRIIAEEGATALYKGMIPALFLTSHGAVKFVAYEKFKSVYQYRFGPDMDVAPTLAIGALAQVFASIATYPYQVLKARLQQGGPMALHYAGAWDCATKILRHEGPRGFFKGLTPNLLKVIPTGAIVFASYEKIQASLKYLVFEREENEWY